MKNKTVRLALVSVVAVLSVLGLSASPADASGRHLASRTGGGWCC
jgi:hypothetical protein